VLAKSPTETVLLIGYGLGILAPIYIVIIQVTGVDLTVWILHQARGTPSQHMILLVLVLRQSPQVAFWCVQLLAHLQVAPCPFHEPGEDARALCLELVLQTEVEAGVG
jgi:hypothetical protein